MHRPVKNVLGSGSSGPKPGHQRPVDRLGPSLGRTTVTSIKVQASLTRAASQQSKKPESITNLIVQSIFSDIRNIITNVRDL